MFLANELYEFVDRKRLVSGFCIGVSVFFSPPHATDQFYRKTRGIISKPMQELPGDPFLLFTAPGIVALLPNNSQKALFQDE